MFSPFAGRTQHSCGKPRHAAYLTARLPSPALFKPSARTGVTAACIVTAETGAAAAWIVMVAAGRVATGAAAAARWSGGSWLPIWAIPVASWCGRMGPLWRCLQTTNPTGQMSAREFRQQADRCTVHSAYFPNPRPSTHTGRLERTALHELSALLTSRLLPLDKRVGHICWMLASARRPCGVSCIWRRSPQTLWRLFHTRALSHKPLAA